MAQVNGYSSTKTNQKLYRVTVKAKTDRIVKSKDGENILIGRTQDIPLKHIKIHPLNRTICDGHVFKMVVKIKHRGFLDTIKVFQSSDGLLYTTAEGAHRILALQLIFGENSDVLIPCLVLPSVYSSDDVDDVLQIIISMNKDNKAWTMKDYVSRWAQTNTRTDFKKILDDMEKYEGGKYPISNAQMCSIYTGLKSNYVSIKDGSYKIKGKYEEYIRLLIDYVHTIKETNGVDKLDGFFPTVTQNFVVFCWGKIKELFLYDFGTPTRRLDYFEEWLSYVSTQLYTQLEMVKTGTLGQNPLATDASKATSTFESHWENFVKNTSVDYRTFDKLG